LIEAEQYKDKCVLVVGGGDSALEAALDVAEQPGSVVALSYRGKAFDRVKPKNRQRLEDAVATNQLNLLMESTVKDITPASVTLMRDGKPVVLDNDAIIVCAGGELPTPFLKKIGIKVEARYGT
jgi:thioredoxin reductase